MHLPEVNFRLGISHILVTDIGRPYSQSVPWVKVVCFMVPCYFSCTGHLSGKGDKTLRLIYQANNVVAAEYAYVDADDG